MARFCPSSARQPKRFCGPNSAIEHGGISTAKVRKNEKETEMHWNVSFLEQTCSIYAAFSHIYGALGELKRRSPPPRSLLRSADRLFGATHGPELLALFTRCFFGGKALVKKIEVCRGVKRWFWESKWCWQSDTRNWHQKNRLIWKLRRTVMFEYSVALAVWCVCKRSVFVSHHLRQNSIISWA